MNEDTFKNVKIMVVDDEVDLEPLVKQKFRRQIRDSVYDFVFAHNGLEALSKLIEYPEIGIILSDINMPEMDGLTLLMKLKELANRKQDLADIESLSKVKVITNEKQRRRA